MTFEEFLDRVNQNKMDDVAIECLRQDMIQIEVEFDELESKRAVTKEVLSRICNL